MSERKTELRKKIWGRKKHYYDITTQAYSNIGSHYGYQLMVPYLRRAHTLIEFGCGNGSVIGNILKYHKKITAYGVDFSALAISEAKKIYHGKLHFKVGNAETTRFPVKGEIVLSFFTFEHLDSPEKVFANMLKATKKNGRVVIVCPNYGSPIYPSPCYKKGMKIRLQEGLERDIRLVRSSGEKKLLWGKVNPIIDRSLKHVIDHDTTIEPYIFAFRRYVEGVYPNLKIEACSSGWHTVQFGKVSMKYWIATLPIRLLALLKIPPFTYWGPVCMLVVQKTN